MPSNHDTRRSAGGPPTCSSSAPPMAKCVERAHVLFRRGDPRFYCWMCDLCQPLFVLQ